MASISVTAPNTVTGNTVTIYFTSDVTLTNVELTKDGTNFITANSFTQTSAVFNVGSWANGTYSNCYLRGTYTSTSNGDSSGGGSTDTTFTIVLGRCGFNSSGNLDSNTSYTHTETYIPFSGNENKTLSWGSSGWTRYVFYDSSKNIIGTSTSDSAITSVKMSELKSLSPNAVYVRMSINMTVSSITLT